MQKEITDFILVVYTIKILNDTYATISFTYDRISFQIDASSKAPLANKKPTHGLV